VIAHEYFHNWTGNRITCRDWFQLCLKEGLTVFRDQEFTSDQRSRPVKRISDVRQLRAHQFVEDAGPLAHPVRPEAYREINNFYTTTVYEKGAEVIRMLKVLLGPGDFRKGMDLYFEQHDGEAATVEDFVRCFADASGRDLSQFMLWYRQAGTPQVAAVGTYDAAAKTYRLDVSQMVPPTPGQPHKEPMVIPLAVGLLDANGRDMPLMLADGNSPERGLLTLSGPAESFVFQNVDERPVASLNRGFSSPVNLVFEQSDEELQFQAAHDSDPFNRWQALQRLAAGMLMSALRSGGGQRDHGALTRALASVLAGGDMEPAFTALALTLPSEADLAREFGQDVDPDAIFRERQALRAAIGRENADALRETYQRMTGKAPYSPDAASAGRRALKNVCLDLLAAPGDASAIARAADQYETADNMTDRLAALATLSLHDVPQREEALDDFYRRFEDDALVIDKWFALQAAIPEAGTLARVRELTSHAAFSLGNPNRVRSLIGAFAQANPTQFNRADGAGYDFVADTVLALDAKNPQVAARLMTAFRAWRTLAPGRRAKAEATLKRVAQVSGLSRDLSDIVERTLAPA